MEIKQPTDIIYSDNFDTKRGNIFEVTDDFLDFLDSQKTFKITGSVDDDLILST